MRIAVYFEFDIISSQNTLRGVTLKDSHGRTIDYLRISLTDRCNFRCVYCMPEEGVCAMSHDEILRIEEIERLVAVAAGLGIRSVRLTGGEPLVRKGVVELVDAITDIQGIENVSMTTNGVLLPRMIGDLKAAGLSRVNISLDTPGRRRSSTRSRARAASRTPSPASTRRSPRGSIP